MLSAARHSTRPFALLAWLLCLPALGGVVAAQEVSRTPAPAESDEVVRVTTELVQTDVMVFDKQGKFVDGLTADQFDLRVDGKPQSITFFERVKAGAVDEDAQLAAARGGATRREGDKRGAVLPLDRGRTVFFFIDDIHLSPGSLVRVQKTLLKFIEDELGQNDEAAIISATGQPGFLQQLTGEKAVLRAAVERLKPRSFAVRDMERPPMSEAQALAIDRNDSSVLDYFVDALQREMPQMSRATLEQMVMQRARGILAQTNHFAVNTLASLEGVVRGSRAAARSQARLLHLGRLPARHARRGQGSPPARDGRGGALRRRHLLGRRAGADERDARRRVRPRLRPLGATRGDGILRTAQLAGAALHARRGHGRARARQHQRARRGGREGARRDLRLLPPRVEARRRRRERAQVPPHRGERQRQARPARRRAQRFLRLAAAPSRPRS